MTDSRKYQITLTTTQELRDLLVEAERTLDVLAEDAVEVQANLAADLAMRIRLALRHPAVGTGQCPFCHHYGEDCYGVSTDRKERSRS